MNEFTNIYALSFYCGILSILLLSLEHKFGNSRVIRDYLKLFILVTSIVFIVLNTNKYLNLEAPNIILGQPNF